MRVCLVFAPLLLAHLSTAAFAVPVAREEGASLRVVGAGAEVVLSPTGAIASVAPRGGEAVFVGAPDATAWVLRAGSQWIAGNALPVQRRVEVRGDAVSVTFVWEGEREGCRVQARAEYRFTDAPEFTLRGAVKNVAGPDVELIAFPGPLRVDGVPLQEVVFPFQRGIVARPPAAGESLSTTVPSGFTDFVFFRTSSGGFAVSEPVPPEPATPTAPDHSKMLALYRGQGSAGAPGGLGYHIDRTLRLAPGQFWSSATTLFQVRSDAAQAARRHWQAGATGRFPTLRQKLPPEVFDRLARSVLFKYPDGRPGGVAGAEVQGLLAALPAPALLHLCGYMPGGHDVNYPDYLPPDAQRVGTLAELQGAMQALRRRGVLLMPYTNPTWWDLRSPTLQRLGLGVAMQGPDGKPRVETYGPHQGVLVDPSHAAIRERLRENWREFTTVLPSDFVFEDQVGARAWIPGSASGPWGYSAAMLENTRTGAKIISLMTEVGWDRLAETQVSFCGNGRLAWEQPPLPADAWRPYPLAQLLANAHAASYPHNLAGERMVHTREELVYNVAFGFQMAYDLNRGVSPWLRACTELQSRVLSRAFGEPVVAFEDRRATDGTTRLTYGNGDEVFANFSPTARSWRGHTVAGQGFGYAAADGSVVAGIFTALDGKPVPEGDRKLLLREGATGEAREVLRFEGP